MLRRVLRAVLTHPTPAELLAFLREHVHAGGVTLHLAGELEVTPGDVAAVLQAREGRTGLKGPKEVG